jgi:hypothetical protein
MLRVLSQTISLCGLADCPVGRNAARDAKSLRTPPDAPPVFFVARSSESF